MRHRILSILCACLGGGSACAPAGEPQTTLSTVVVSAARTETPAHDTAAGISVIDRDQIERSGARSLPELLRGEAGVHVADLYGDGTTATLDMRGFGPTAGSNTLVLVDGRRLNNNSDIAPPSLTGIDPDEVERIEIVRGSAGVLYGNQAVGGVIHVITRRPARSGGEIRVEGGSYDARGASARLSLADGSGLGGQVWASRRRSDNYRERNDTELDNLGGRIEYGHEGGRLFAEVEHTATDQQLPGSLFRHEMDAGLDQVGAELRRIRRWERLPGSLLEAFFQGGRDRVSAGIGMLPLSALPGEFLDGGAARVSSEIARIRLEQQLPGSLLDDLAGADRRQSADDYAGDFSDSDTDTARIGLRQRLTERWSLEAELTRREEDRDFQISFRGFPGSPATQDRATDTFSPRLIGRLSPGGLPVDLTLGYDREQTDYRLETQFGPQTVDQTISGVYGQAVARPAPQWALTAGVRRAWVDNHITQREQITLGSRTFEVQKPYDLDDRVTVGSLGLSWSPGPAWRLFARADQNFRFATVDEHTNPVFDQPVGLENQTGISYETGASYDWGRGRIELTLYRLELENEISFDATGFANVNLEETRREGLILEGELSPGAGWRIGGDYAYTAAEITDGPFEGNDTPLVPEHSVKLYVDKTFGPHWTLHTEALHVGRQVLGGDFANRVPRLDAYTLVNVHLRFRQGPVELSLRVNNLLDELYSETGSAGLDTAFVTRDAYFPAPERNFRLEAGYRF
jgi:outer membrane receptor protein involved in Fe transport